MRVPRGLERAEVVVHHEALAQHDVPHVAQILDRARALGGAHVLVELLERRFGLLARVREHHAIRPPVGGRHRGDPTPGGVVGIAGVGRDQSAERAAAHPPVLRPRKRAVRRVDRRDQQVADSREVGVTPSAAAAHARVDPRRVLRAARRAVLDADHDQRNDLTAQDQALAGLVHHPFTGEAGADVEEVLPVVHVEHRVALHAFRVARREVDPAPAAAEESRRGKRLDVPRDRALIRPARHRKLHGLIAARRQRAVRDLLAVRALLDASPIAARELELDRLAVRQVQRDGPAAVRLFRQCVGRMARIPPLEVARDEDRVVGGRGRRNAHEERGRRGREPRQQGEGEDGKDEGAAGSAHAGFILAGDSGRRHAANPCDRR